MLVLLTRSVRFHAGRRLIWTPDLGQVMWLITTGAKSQSLWKHFHLQFAPFPISNNGRISMRGSYMVLHKCRNTPTHTHTHALRRAYMHTVHTIQATHTHTRAHYIPHTHTYHVQSQAFMMNASCLQSCIHTHTFSCIIHQFCSISPGNTSQRHWNHRNITHIHVYIQ